MNFDLKGPVVCPKPQMVGVFASNHLRPFRWHMRHHVDICESKAGGELLDIVLGPRPQQEENLATQIASSPPPFGSPPVRVSNPLIQDSLFGDRGKIAPTPALSSPSLSSARKGRCVRAKIELNPGAVRVEGFDCLKQDLPSSSIPSVA